MKPPEILQAVDPEGQARSVFDKLAEKAIRIHTRTKSLVRTFKTGDTRDGLYIDDAAKAAIEGSKIPPILILAALMRITSVSPQSISSDFGFPGENWDEFATAVSRAILWKEIYLAHPELDFEDGRREQYWSSRRKK